MNKKTRELVRCKFDGLCAYSGKPLGDDWQVDHVTSKAAYSYRKNLSGRDDIDNLLPAIKIVNHYKRSLCLSGFRKRIQTLHLRLAKLPKKTNAPLTIKRKEYLLKVAEIFDITVDKPFDGLFYFEKIDSVTTKQ